MNLWILMVVLVLSVVALMLSGWAMVRDETPGDVLFGVLAATELVLVVQAVVGVVALGGTDREISAVTFVSYLLAVLLVLPIGAFWSLAERSRAGTAVLVVAVLTVLAVEVRLDAIWGSVLV